MFTSLYEGDVVMYKQKCCVLFFLTGLTLLIAAGCNHSGKNNGIDQKQFQIVEKYVYEIVPAVEGAKYDIDQWFGDIADSQILEWLECDAELIDGINNSHLNADFPDFTLMEKWSDVPVVRGDEKWNIEGHELAALVKTIISSTGELTMHLKDVLFRTGEEATEKEKRQVGVAIDEAYQAARELRSMFGFDY